jgi:hypothetical protein
VGRLGALEQKQNEQAEEAHAAASGEEPSFINSKVLPRLAREGKQDMEGLARPPPEVRGRETRRISASCC